MDKTIKSKLLEYIDEIKQNELFWKNIGNQKLGSTNIRSMATTVLNADCYKELELYVAYKTAKGNGWEEIFKNGKKFGEVILEYMDNIKALSNSEEEALLNISKFFGYLYWFRRSIEKGGK